jgi:hypothetical protein
VNFPLQSQTNSRRGIALLITLVILALLAVFMTEFSFETKLETRGIQNYQASFKARNAVKSMFKAVLEGLEGQEEVKFFRQYVWSLISIGNSGRDISILNPPNPVRLPAGVISDFPDVSFYTPYIRPIDQLYNLNRIQPRSKTGIPESKSDVHLANQFINILKKWNLSAKTQAGATFVTQNITISENEILTIYTAIFDWMDKDLYIYDSSVYGTIGAETDTYLIADLPIEIKNGHLDQLNEIMLINGIENKRTPLELWDNSFTTYPVGNKYESFADHTSIKPRINVNLATYEEIVEFLEQFDQFTNYFTNFSQSNYENNYAQNFYQKRNEIADELTKLPRVILSSNDIKNKLRKITQYYSKIHDYFTPYSYWYEIRLKTEIDNVIALVKAIVSVNRNNDTGKVTKLIIHDFLLQ